MRFGLMTEPQLGMTYDELLRAARFAESIGLDVFARSDHYGFMGLDAPHATDALATLAGLARDTERIELCVLVSPITFRHPAVMAKNAATIDEMSGGRLRLGLGTGWMEHEHTAYGLPFPPWQERFLRLEETLIYLRAVFGKEKTGFSGTYYSAQGPARPAPTGRLPIVVGGSGAVRTPRLAGRLADEYNITFVPAGGIPARVEKARQAAEEAGRDPESLLISLMGPAITGPDEAAFRRNVEATAASDPFGRSGDVIVEQLANHGLPVGAGPQARDILERLAAAGVQLFYLQHMGQLDFRLLEELFTTLNP